MLNNLKYYLRVVMSNLYSLYLYNYYSFSSQTV